MKIMKTGIRLVAISILLLTACHTVPPGHTGVQIWFSKVQNEVLEEGFHGINPFLNVVDMSLQTQNLTMDDSDPLKAISSDQLRMTAHVTVLYHLSSKGAPGILRLMPNYQEDIVKPTIKVATRDAIRSFKAIDAVGIHRQKVGSKMNELVRERLKNAMKQRNLYENSIIIDDVQLRDLQLPPELRNSIARVQKQRQQANEREQAIETSRQEALRQTIEAEGQAKVKIIRAKNRAEARIIHAKSEAMANRMISKSITPQIVRIREVEAQRAVLSSPQTRTIFVPFGKNQSQNILMNMQ
jgi:regulator of protease activity HflC (stomatin/prohibitin superfamily)